MLRTPLCVLLFVITNLAPTAHAGETYRSEFRKQTDRVWVGPDFLACRHQDWRVVGGWLECTEGRVPFPMRTCALLPRELDPARGTFHLQAEVRATATGERHAKECAGFLFAIGGLEVDHRIRSLVQGKPAPGGGILAVVDGHGRVAFRDFSLRHESDRGASIDGPLAADACPILSPELRSGPGLPETARNTPLLLELTGEFDGEETMRVIVRALVDGIDEVSRAELTKFPIDRIDGSISLVSHLGPAGSGHAFRKVHFAGKAVVATPERSIGPVMGVLYTVDRGTLRLTAQLPPLGPDDPLESELQLLGPDGAWTTVALAERAALSDTATFRVAPFPAARDTPFRVVTALGRRGGSAVDFAYDGIIRREPIDALPRTIAVIDGVQHFSGDLAWDASRLWFPHREVSDAILSTTPDLFVCSGGAIDREGLHRPDLSSEAATRLDLQTRWHRFFLSFGEITRTTPTIVVPGAADFLHEHLYGAGNVRADGLGLGEEDAGGYRLSRDLVNAIITTRTAHLPSPIDPTPVGPHAPAEGVHPFTTRLEYAGVSVAVLDGHLWKSAPGVLLPEAKVKESRATNPDFDWRKEGEPRRAELLGERQEAFLAEWGVDYAHGARWKLLLGPDLFTSLATRTAGARIDPTSKEDRPRTAPIPRAGVYPPAEIPVADPASNGWPMSARDRAVASLTRGSALHLAGNRGLASVVRYGVEAPGNAGWAFGIPSVVNPSPRRWFPATAGANRSRRTPRNLGEFIDAFGNAMRVVAVANPMRTEREPALLHDRAPGFGLVRLDPGTGAITLEAWPRAIDPLGPQSAQFVGWPLTIEARELDGRRPWGTLLPVTSPFDAPIPWVVRVRTEPEGALILARRLAPGETWAPSVFAPGLYTVEVGSGDGDVGDATGAWQVRTGQIATPIVED